MSNTHDILLRFPSGMPKGTAQEKGECIRYRITNGKRVPYIHHFKKENIASARKEFEIKLKRFRPATPSTAPIRLQVYLFFDIKGPKKVWGTYKTTRPDCSNFIKELEDAMTACGFWKDDSQVAELKVQKRWASDASIFIRWEELEP